jgi:hypothetical protein
MMLKHAAKQVLGKSRSDAISYRRRLVAYGEAYLKPLGWDRSVVSRQAEDRDGPVPWITYPALRMLDRIVQPHFKVFEYGAGNSSLWWASRVAEVVAVEHDPIWAELVASRAPDNLRVLSRPMGAPAAEPGRSEVAAFLAAHPNPPLSGDEAKDVADGLVWAPFAGYLAELACYPAGWFDVVVVDGMARWRRGWSPPTGWSSSTTPTAGSTTPATTPWRQPGSPGSTSTAPGRCWSTSPARPSSPGRSAGPASPRRSPAAGRPTCTGRSDDS